MSLCSNGNNQGSFCALTCRPNQELIGNKRIRCRSNGEWIPNVERTRCRNRRGECIVIVYMTTNYDCIGHKTEKYFLKYGRSVVGE